jgi:hypothetical protein
MLLPWYDQDLSTTTLDVKSMLMTSKGLGVLQLCLRGNNEDEFITTEGLAFLHVLSELFIDESGVCSRVLPPLSLGCILLFTHPCGLRVLGCAC